MERSGGEGRPLPVALQQILDEVRRSLDDPSLVDEVMSALPAVDPENPRWEDLYRWGETIAKIGRLTPETSDLLVRIAKKYAARNR